MMATMLTIDGSQGEGGGQVLRTSLGLSLLTGQPFRIEKIRAGRAKPGLLRQHLTAVHAARDIGGAEVSGAELGSRELSFRPGRVTAGDYSFAVGTAGSATLVLQTVLPALLVGSKPARLTISGGTHNLAAPPYDFLERAFARVVNATGARLELTLHRAGFYPAGGGSFTAEIRPAERLAPVELVERGHTRSRRGRAVVSNLPYAIAEREVAVLQRRLSWLPDELRAETVHANGPGNVVMIEVESENVTEVFTAFGERGVPAETVAERAAKTVRRYLKLGAAIDEHLADQVLVPMAIAGRGAFTTGALSAHATTNIEVIRRFLDVDFRIYTRDPGLTRVEVVPTGA
jgi:RNA 3'-terminal phosphate cyclase (ATP)